MAEFAAGAGHEINNPLTVISGRAQLLLRNKKNPERRRSFGADPRAGDAAGLRDDRRHAAVRPAPELQRQRCDLAALADRVVAELGPRAAAQNTQLSRPAEYGPVEIEADPTHLAVALQAVASTPWKRSSTTGASKFACTATAGKRGSRWRTTGRASGPTSAAICSILSSRAVPPGGAWAWGSRGLADRHRAPAAESKSRTGLAAVQCSASCCRAVSRATFGEYCKISWGYT